MQIMYTRKVEKVFFLLFFLVFCFLVQVLEKMKTIPRKVTCTLIGAVACSSHFAFRTLKIIARLIPFQDAH